VFAKYYALHAQEPSTLEAQDPPRPASGFVEDHSYPVLPDMFEIQQNLRDLQQRFKDLEFEKVERRRIRSEIRALDDGIQETLGGLAARQDDLEKQLSDLANLQPRVTPMDLAELRNELRAIDLEPVHRRIGQAENRIQACAADLSTKTSPRLLELLPKLEGRLNEAEGRISAMAESVRNAQGNGAPPHLDTALKGLEDLKVALQNVTVRYSEIGELKKNYLILRNMLESLQQSMETFRKESANGPSARTAELEKEVFALRAEVRKAYERMELLEVPVAPAAPAGEFARVKEVLTLKEELTAVSKSRSEDRERILSDLQALESRVGDRLQPLIKLPEKLESFSSQIRKIDQQYQPLSKTLEIVCNATNGAPQKIADLGKDFAALREEFLQTQSQMQALQEKLDGLETFAPQGDAAPTHGDMQAIRQNLDEIRRFMSTLSKKL
jgi:chromosome segregation ATPase